MQNKKISKLFVFKKKPSFAKLWDTCLYNLLYDAQKYAEEIEQILTKLGMSKDSNFIDVSAGTGFMSMELAERGYKFDFMDATDDEIAEFSKKAKEKNLQIRCKKIKWLDIPKTYDKDSFDMVFCRGNSFIYAAGGWNKLNKIDYNKSIELYEKTLKIFYDLLKTGGWLYIDKFKDNETPGKASIGKAIISGRSYDLFFYSEIKKNEKYRMASILLRDEHGNEKGLPNVTPILKLPKLISMLKKAGFKEVKKFNLKNEKHFDVILTKK